MFDITIAIPVYNVEKYIKKSLLSALNQDFEGSFEILIIDDRGTDNSMQIVHDVVAEHHKGNLVRIVNHEQNKGLGPARNTAIENANSKYIFFLDSDDWIREDCLRKLFTVAEKEQCEITCGSVQRVNESDGSTLAQNIYPFRSIKQDSAGAYMMLSGIFMHIELWNKLFLLDFIRSNGITCVHKIMEDSIFDFNARVLAKTIVQIPDITLFYNIREGSILTNLIHKKSSDESVYVYCDIVDQMQQLIVNKYSHIPGIYDLYIQRVIYSLEGLERSTQTPEQKSRMSETFAKSICFIPNQSVIKNLRHKLFYMLAKRESTPEKILRRYDLSRKLFNLISLIKRKR